MLKLDKEYLIRHATHCLNLQSFEVSMRSKITFQCHSEVMWRAPNSSVAWFCLLNEDLCSHFLILTKTLLKLFHGFCTKCFGGSVKDVCFLKFHNRCINVFVNTCKGNYFFIFLVMVTEFVKIGCKFERTLKSSISFILSSFSRTWVAQALWILEKKNLKFKSKELIVSVGPLPGYLLIRKDHQDFRWFLV